METRLPSPGHPVPPPLRLLPPPSPRRTGTPTAQTTLVASVTVPPGGTACSGGFVIVSDSIPTAPSLTGQIQVKTSPVIAVQQPPRQGRRCPGPAHSRQVCVVGIGYSLEGGFQRRGRQRQDAACGSQRCCERPACESGHWRACLDRAEGAFCLQCTCVDDCACTCDAYESITDLGPEWIGKRPRRLHSCARTRRGCRERLSCRVGRPVDDPVNQHVLAMGRG